MFPTRMRDTSQTVTAGRKHICNHQYNSFRNITLDNRRKGDSSLGVGPANNLSSG